MISNGFCNNVKTAEVLRAAQEAQEPEEDTANEAKPEETAQSSEADVTEDENPQSKDTEPVPKAEDVPAAVSVSSGKTGINSNGQKGTLTGDSNPHLLCHKEMCQICRRKMLLVSGSLEF